ncbi:hypothetical protein AB0M47_35505 [Hamadaea sp. NPDC051192]|uniref:hypothetical protein n=1 Tax=Hamadaea sp. NPDC051192 TaxID=3154940 RepID=UPI003426001D
MYLTTRKRAATSPTSPKKAATFPTAPKKALWTRAVAMAIVVTGTTAAYAAPAAAAGTDPIPASVTAAVSASKAASEAADEQALGLDEMQLANARTIVEVGLDLGLSQRAMIIAVATAMQESALYNLASTALPESYDYDHDSDGSDHDSIGLFQQRPSAGWGTVAEIMDPAYAAKAFYQALQRVDGWATMALTVAAQAVQVSAYPDAYAEHESAATKVVTTLLS